MAKITLGGKEYTLRYPATLAEKIQNRYGSLAALADAITSPKTTVWLLTELINAGSIYDAYMCGVPRKEPVTEEFVDIMLGIGGLSNPAYVDAIVEAFNEGIGKNVKAEDLMDLAASTIRAISTAPKATK